MGVGELRLDDFHTAEHDAYKKIIQEFKFEAIEEKYHLHDKVFGGEQYKRQKAVFLDILVKTIPDPNRFEDTTIKSLIGALPDNVEDADWHRPILSMVKYIMKHLCHPLLNWHIKVLGNLFLRNYFVAKQVANKTESDGSLSSCIFHLECYPEIIQLLDDMFYSLVTSVVREGARQCHTSIRPLYSTLVPRLLTETEFPPEADGQTRSGGIADAFRSTFSSAVRDKMKSGTRAEVYRNLDTRRHKVHKQLQDSASGAVSSIIPEERKLIADDKESGHIKAIAFHYILGLVHYLEKILSMNLDTFILVDFRTALEDATIQSAFQNLPEESIFREYQSFEDAVEKILEKDDGSQEAEMRRSDVEAQLSDVRDALRAIEALEMVELSTCDKPEGCDDSPGQ